MHKRLASCLAAIGLAFNAGCAGAAAPADTGQQGAAPSDGGSAVTDKPRADLEALALRVASEHLDVPADELEVTEIAPIEWRDSSLGCPDPGMNYLHVIIPGHYAVVHHEGKTWRVHMAHGRAFICERRPGKDENLKRPLLELTLSQAQLETLARADLARRLGVPKKEVSVRETRSIVWPDGGLGCAAPTEPPSSGQSKGYVMMLGHGDREYEYHADLRRVIPCPPIESR